MFGGDLVPPKASKRVKPHPLRLDIQFPSTHPGYYSHIAREPNTDYHVKLLHYKQRKNADDIAITLRGKNASIADAATVKYDKHAEKKRLQRLIEERVQKKMAEYDTAIEKRREKLLDLFYNEERQYYYEAIDEAQKGQDFKMGEMKKRAEILRANREEERLKIVHQKRIEQYRDRCHDLRPALHKKHLIETKNAQLQQIRENEARREAERELEKMWHHLSTKEILARMDREQQDLMAEKYRQNDLLETWDKQVRGKQLMKEEADQVAQEDRIEMVKLSEQIRREQIAALDAKRRKRDETEKELREQIATQDSLLAQRKKEEDALNDAFTILAEMEIERERQAVKDLTTQAKRESLQYRRNLAELEAERQREEKELNELLEYHRKEMERKQDEAKCKILMAKQELQRQVMQGRDEQIKDRRQRAQQQLELKEAENELLKMAYDMNERLQAESDRLEAEAIRQYRDDLQKQIDYNNLLRQREREVLERQLEQGRQEEEKYRQIVRQMIDGQIEPGGKHPFRRVFERHDCHCPPPNN